ncbi:unnamed protein product [Haemonchus placei]|uniref:Uncharacterized protein n=1 Tax=Haemonchus placei TaxID=6290 RepID=A0A3P7X1X3_HAEPC|nr:unnamed protein product [Haemonchus placei]
MMSHYWIHCQAPHFNYHLRKLSSLMTKWYSRFYSDRDASQELTLCYDWINRIRVRYQLKSGSVDVEEYVG